MKKILVLYYSQSGQLKDILDSLTSNIQEKAEIDFAEIKPRKPFPFPWTATSFFDAMPESVLLIPSPIEPINQRVLETEYDLVIFGYQPWFLSPSQPTTSFLKSEYSIALKGKPVITVIGCRNMWLNGQEKVKAMIQQAGGNLVGNIVLNDTYPNLISLLTIIRWNFTGQKEASKYLPAAGVQEKEIKGAQKFGMPILTHLNNNALDGLQKELLMLGAVYLKPGLVLLEKRGIKNFRYWAKFIREKGGPGAPERKGRVKTFQRLLLTGIFILSPISSLTAKIKLQMQKRNLLKDVEYFKGVKYEPERI